MWKKIFQDILRMMKNLVAADKDGNWHLHGGFDSINY